MESPYKIKHWSPVKRVPKSVDPYWNVVEWEEIHADEYEILEIQRPKASGSFFLYAFTKHKHSTT